MQPRRTSSAFTLLEIMIVVTLIGVLAAIAVPSYQHSVAKTQARVCVTNLKNIEIAKAQWMAESGKDGEETPGDTDLFGEDRPIRDKPKCPSGGTYDLRAARAKPTCSIPGHSY